MMPFNRIESRSLKRRPGVTRDAMGPCFDRWDIIEAHYAFYTDWHSGQSSREYRRLCRIRQYWRPGKFWQGYAALTDNGEQIYDDLCAKHLSGEVIE